MEEKILDATLAKIYELTSQDLACPNSVNMSKLSKEQIVSLYDKAWSLICDVHDLAFKCSQTQRLFKTLGL